MIAPIIAKPAKAAPTQYRTNITLLAIATVLMAFWIDDGQFKSERLTPDLSSLCRMAVGSKWKRAVWLEHLVRFLVGCMVSFATAVGM